MELMYVDTTPHLTTRESVMFKQMLIIASHSIWLMPWLIVELVTGIK